MKLKKPFSNLLFIVPFSLFLVVINIIRIIKIPITIDETGYNPYDTYWQLVTETYPSANNHILHSLIRKFFVEFFSTDLFFYRLDSLLAQITYLVFTYLLCRLLFKNRWWELACFIILSTLSPLIFNFWGLSRGYALAMCFMTMSIYYLMKFQTVRQSKYLIFSFPAGILSVWGNFGSINYFIGLVGVIIFNNLLTREDKPKGLAGKELIIMISSCLLLAMIATVPLIRLHKNGELMFLGTKGFFADTITSLAIDNQFAGPTAPMVDVVRYSVVAITILTGFFWIFVYFKNKYYKQTIDPESLRSIDLTMLLVIPSASLILQHNLLSINYLIGRTALYFVILFLLQFLFFLYFMRKRVRFVSPMVLAVLFCFITWNFFSKLNLFATYYWWFDIDDVAMIQKIQRETKDTHKVKLGVRWNSFGGVRYDVAKYYPNTVFQLNEPINFDAVDTTLDYCFVEVGDLIKIPKMYVRDTEFVGGSYILLKNSKPK